MKTLIARAALGAALVATTTATAPPASALTSATLQGTMEISCFGCGETDWNSATFAVTGVWANRLTVNGPGWASFTVNAPAGDLCAASGWMTGTMTVQTGVDRVTSGFRIVHLGGTGTLHVDGVGQGPISMVITSPVGVPCGSAVTISFTAKVAG